MTSTKTHTSAVSTTGRLLHLDHDPAGGIPEIYNNLRSNDGVLIMWDEL